MNTGKIGYPEWSISTDWTKPLFTIYQYHLLEWVEIHLSCIYCHDKPWTKSVRISLFHIIQSRQHTHIGLDWIGNYMFQLTGNLIASELFAGLDLMNSRGWVNIRTYNLNLLCGLIHYGWIWHLILSDIEYVRAITKTVK